MSDLIKGIENCPFCGSSDLFISKELSQDGTITWSTLRHGAKSSCSVTMLDSDEDRLINRWNTRAVIK